MHSKGFCLENMCTYSENTHSYMISVICEGKNEYNFTVVKTA